MEYILNNTILALLEYPDSTLLGINRMLSDVEYRKKVVDNVKDPIVKAFWETEYARYTQRYEIEATAAIQNKVGQFVSNALIRNVIGQTKSTINMRKIMDEGKVLILDLSKGRIGEDNSRLLGALLITKLQLAAMSRVDIPEPQRKDFYLYVDEFQNFATESFANILSEARKYRLNLIVGHQYINQMDEIVRDAVFGNVGTLAVFRVGAEDAEFLEKEFSPEFTAEDLVNLAKYNIYLKLMIDGVASHPFSAETLPPAVPLEESNREKIIEASRERYGIKRELVEEKIIDWTGGSGDGTKAAPVVAGKPAAAPVPQKMGLGKPLNSVATTTINNSENQTVLYDAICSMCGKPTKVIFEPKEGRPVYCKSCLKKMKASAEANTVKPVAPIVKEVVSSPPQKEKEEPSLVVKKPQATAPKESHVSQEPTVIENISFSSSRKKTSLGSSNVSVHNHISQKQENHIHVAPPKSETKRKEINLSELRKALEESLQHRDEEDIVGDEDEIVDDNTMAEEATTPLQNKEKEVVLPTTLRDAKLVNPPSEKELEEGKLVDPKKEQTEEDSKKGVIDPGQKITL
jgi:CxxC-x17-CxxC domain-containing protein